MEVVTHYVYQKPSLLRYLQKKKLTDVIMHSFLVKNPSATREVFHCLMCSGQQNKKNNKFTKNNKKKFCYQFKIKFFRMFMAQIGNLVVYKKVLNQLTFQIKFYLTCLMYRGGLIKLKGLMNKLIYSSKTETQALFLSVYCKMHLSM